MRKGLFKSLLFREFYITRKIYVMYLSIFMIAVADSLLALLSYRCGNLHTYSHLIQRNIIDCVIKYLPIGFAGCFFGANMDSVAYEENVAWRRFRISCPATPFQLALAKYSCYGITLLIALILSFSWLGLYNLLTGGAVNQQDINIILTIFFVIALIITVITNVTIWLKGRLLAGTILGIIFFVLVMGCMFYIDYIEIQPAQVKLLWLTLVPFTPLFIVAVLLLGLLCTTMLYRRREK